MYIHVCLLYNRYCFQNGDYLCTDYKFQWNNNFVLDINYAQSITRIATISYRAAFILYLLFITFE